MSNIETKLFLEENISLKMNLPEWFLHERGDMGVTFVDQIQRFGFIQLPNVYRKLYQMMKYHKDLVFIDVGANFGFTSLPIAILGNEVVAIEPLSINHDVLVANRDNNGLSFDILKCAIDEVNEQKEIFTLAQSDCASLLPDSVTEISHLLRTAVSEKVFSQRLDQLIKCDNQSKFFVKIDVQGYEKRVINSMRKLFDQGVVKYILIELEERYLKNDGTSTEEIKALLRNEGFSVENFYGDDFLCKKI